MVAGDSTLEGDDCPRRHDQPARGRRLHAADCPHQKHPVRGVALAARGHLAVLRPVPPDSRLRVRIAGPATSPHGEVRLRVAETARAPATRRPSASTGKTRSPAAPRLGHAGHRERDGLGHRPAADAHATGDGRRLSGLPRLALLEAAARHARLHGAGAAQPSTASGEGVPLLQAAARAVGRAVQGVSGFDSRHEGVEAQQPPPRGVSLAGVRAGRVTAPVLRHAGQRHRHGRLQLGADTFLRLHRAAALRRAAAGKHQRRGADRVHADRPVPDYALDDDARPTPHH
jgi:hypothetical protein